VSAEAKQAAHGFVTTGIFIKGDVV